jgi:hypothetical protein
MELYLTTMLTTVLVIGFVSSIHGFFNIIFEDNKFAYKVIENYKLDVNKLRFLPRIIFIFFIFIIECSYNLGAICGKFLKILLVK